MKRTPFSRNNILLLFFVLIIGVVLSILSYQYSSFTSDEIAKIASQDVRSNARIQTYDLSRILVHSLDSINSNLNLLNNAILESGNRTSLIQSLLDTAQSSTSNLTVGYSWIDQRGNLIASSIPNQKFLIDNNFNNTNVSSKEYFQVPKNTLKPYYSTVEHISVGGSSLTSPNLFVSIPIIADIIPSNSSSPSIDAKDRFRGVVLAAISVKSLGEFLKNEISFSLGNVGLIDKNGVIIYTRDPSLIGKNYLSQEFQSLVAPELIESYNRILTDSLTGKSAAEDLTYQGLTTTLSYYPIVINNEFLWSLYISSPHQLANNVGLIINQQKNFSTVIVIIIGAVAVGIAYLILSWNKRLEVAVNTRTSQLRQTNISLLESNRLLAEANKQLEVHGKMQKEFINIAAHELRTPIMPILGEIEFIEQQLDNENKSVKIYEEQIKLIVRNAKRLDRLASDILDVTRIESQSLKINKDYFNLDDIIQDAIQDIKNQLILEGSDKKIDFIYKPNNITIFCDKDRINQVILNLFSNSLKFTDSGGSIIVTTKIDSKNNMIVISVKDTGKGIDPEIYPRLFCKFATKSDKGTGLGLYISKNIIDAHNGRIWAENHNDPSGAIFTFTIPYQNSNNSSSDDDRIESLD